MSYSRDYKHLVCKSCGKIHQRKWNALDGYGLCNDCGGKLGLPSKLKNKQDEKIRKELEELEKENA